jgi:hypothetical protein
MDTTPVKTKPTRLSKGLRKHNRRMKQEARRTTIPATEMKKKKRAA